MSQLEQRRESTRRQLLFSPSVEDEAGYVGERATSLSNGEPCCARDARGIDAEELAQSGTGIAAPEPVRS